MLLLSKNQCRHQIWHPTNICEDTNCEIGKSTETKYVSTTEIETDQKKQIFVNDSGERIAGFLMPKSMVDTDVLKRNVFEL